MMITIRVGACRLRLLIAAGLGAGAIAGCVESSAPPMAAQPGAAGSGTGAATSRRRTLIDNDWRFVRGDPPDDATSLLYDVRPQGAGGRGGAPATAPLPPPGGIVKAWILPDGQ